VTLDCSSEASTRVNERSEYRRRRCVVMATGLVTFPWLLYIIMVRVAMSPLSAKAKDG
jgi:hypothetical protein